MRRLIGLSLGILFLAACGEMKDPSTVDVLPEEDPALPTGSEIYDGASGQEGANPHFYFLSPIAESNPSYTGVADDNLRPTVTICPLESWDTITNSCTVTPLATFGMEPDEYGTAISVDPGVKYSVVWKSNNYPLGLEPGSTEESLPYRVAVSVAQRALGWADIKGYTQTLFNSYDYLDPEGYIAVPLFGNLNISFRIEDGALEAAYCDPTNLEDCDVQVFSAAEEGCLRVFENPNGSGQALGSQACVPANAAVLNNAPVEGDFAVILTLEKNGVTQGGTVPGDYQIPYFPDVKTDPPGISFDQESSGLGLVICQVESGIGALPESLHDQLRPVLVFNYSDGSTETTLPPQYSYGAPECEDFASMASHDHRGQKGEEGLLSRVAQGFSRVTSLFLPKPLVARRLHGGLNTTVYNTGGDATPGGENVAAFDMGTGEARVEAFGLVPADPDATEANFPSDSGLEESPVAFTIQPFTFDPVTGQSTMIPLYDFWANNGEPIAVEWWVEGANPNGSAETPNQAGGPDGDGIFDAAYTPTEPGYDYIHITVNGEEIAGSPFTYQVLPLTGPIEVYVQITSNSGGAPAPADGLPVNLYAADGSMATATTVATGTPGVAVATFDEQYSGSYTVYLPKRDFDVDFNGIEYSLDHSPSLENATSTATFTGTSYDLPAGVAVYRIKDAGTGNAYQYVLDNRSWTSAQNQIRGVTLRNVEAHLATITGGGENGFVATLVSAQCPNETNEKRCKYQGWIGLSDDAVEGNFQWVTGEPLTYTSWKEGEPSGKNNEDQVEINLFGFWTDENGASSTNEGYVTEYDAQQPPPNPASGG